MSDEYTLTDEQVENWRKILITLPLPPFNLSLGVYALIMPREKVVAVAQRINEEIQLASEQEPMEEKPTNIIRTRPRNPNKPTR